MMAEPFKGYDQGVVVFAYLLDGASDIAGFRLFTSSPRRIIRSGYQWLPMAASSSRSIITGSRSTTSTASAMTACRTTGMGRSASAMPAWSMKLTSWQRRRLRKARHIGSASTQAMVSRLRSCRWPSSSRIRTAYCVRPTRTAPGRTKPSMQHAMSRAEIGGGWPISDYA